MQINYRNALVLALMFTLQCNGMDNTTKKAKKQKEVARAQARFWKQQKHDFNAEYAAFEANAQRTLTQREAKRNAQNKSPFTK